MNNLTWIQLGIGGLLLVAYLVSMKRRTVISKHYVKANKETVKMEWDPKARRRLLSVLSLGGILNLVLAGLGIKAHDAVQLSLFFVGILLPTILLFIITYYVEKDNLKRLGD